MIKLAVVLVVVVGVTPTLADHYQRTDTHLPNASGSHRLNRGFLVPPGTPFNSRSEPYSRSLETMSPQERKNVANSMSWIKAHMGHPEAWCFDWSSIPDLTAHIPPDEQEKRACRRKVH